jgi:hypothetical protein
MFLRVVCVVLSLNCVLAIFEVSSSTPTPLVGGECCATGESCVCSTVYPNFNQNADQNAQDAATANGVNPCGGDMDMGVYFNNEPTKEWCDKPQSTCAVGFYQQELFSYTSCAGQSGNKIIGFAKESMTSAGTFNDYNMVLTLPQHLTDFYIKMTVYSTDLDMLFGHSTYSDPNGKTCIVGKDCTFDRTAVTLMPGCSPGTGAAPSSFAGITGFCINEDDFTNPEPSAQDSNWYWSGATEGPQGTGGSTQNEGFGAKEIKNRDYEVRVFAAQTGWGKLEYSFAAISPCPQFPLPNSCADDPDVENIEENIEENLVEVTGDPHMRNMNGEVFDLSAEGDHVLIQIPAGSGEELEVVGTVSGFQKMRKCPLFFLTKLKMQGSLVGSEPINILTDEGKFGVRVGSELLNLDFNTPLTIGAAKVEKCDEDNLFCKSTVPKRRTPSHANKFHVALPSNLHVVASSYSSANPSFINIAVSGLASHHDVGGLLGHDDHSHVTSEVSCSSGKSSMRKTSMLQTVFDVESSTVGHLAM